MWPWTPQWKAQKERAVAYAAMGMQRAPGNSTRGLDHTLVAGLGREEHMRQAMLLRSPFDEEAQVVDDLEFAVMAMVAFGPRVAA